MSKPATLPAIIDASPPAPTEPKRSPRGQVAGRLKRALYAMAWDNLTDNEAAVKFNITVTAIRTALKRPAARMYFKEQRDVLKARESPRNLHRMIELRDQDDNKMVALHAARLLDGEADGVRPLININIQPGVVVDLQAPMRPHQMADQEVIELNPLESNGSVTDEG